MAELDDVQLRYHVRLEGLSRATLRGIMNDISAALDKIEADLSRLTPEDAPFTHGRLQALRSELASLRAALTERLAGCVSEALDAVIETSAALGAATARSLSVGLQVSFTTVPVEMLAVIKSIRFDDRTWPAWGAKLGEDTMARITAELAQAAALGESLPKVRNRLANVADLSRVSAERLARTAINATANRARAEVLSQLPEVVGWRYLATLDSRTSPQCRALDGKVFRKDDPSIPWPPRHPNCRSVMLPMTDLDAEPLGERPSVPVAEPLLLQAFAAKSGIKPVRTRAALPRGFKTNFDKFARQRRRALISRVPAGQTFAEWLTRQPKAFQREVLGPTRFRAFKRGLPIGAMATVDRPLTIAELRRLYPQDMQGL